ncbi:DNA transposase THAP9 isoform 3-T3 [Theristicus caerulescens]
MGRRELGRRAAAANGRARSVAGRAAAAGRGGGGGAAMTRSCSALGCTARDNGRSRERGISFHQFPVDAAQRREWIRAVNRVDPRSRQAWRPGPGAILCSRHFAEADFERYGLRRKLRRGAVPSRFPHPEPLGAGRRSGPPVRALKRSLPSPPAGDHNYSLKEQQAAGGEARPPLETPQQQVPAAGRCSPAHRPRTVANVLRELAEKRQLSEETVSLLQAQFSGKGGERGTGLPLLCPDGTRHVPAEATGVGPADPAPDRLC